MTAKRPASTGTIRPISASSFQVRWRDHAGQHSETVRGTKQDAERRLVAILHARDQGLAVATDRRRTFGAFLALWWADHKETLQPSTVRRQQQVMDAYLSDLADAKLAGLDEFALTAAVAKWRDRGTPPTQLNKAVVMLKTVMRDAHRRRAIAHDPAQYIRVPSVARRKVQPPTREQVDAVLRAVRDHHAFPAFALSASTGMRIGEVIALRWQDVDLERRVVTIPKSKTAAGLRTFHLPPSVAVMLADYQGAPDSPVAASLAGTPMDERNLRRVLRATCDQLGIPRFRWHDFRHAAATALLDMGNDISKVAAFLGHTNPAFTRQVYVHLYPELAELDVALDIPADLAARPADDRKRGRTGLGQ